MSYILEHQDESIRLEEQSKQKHYSLEDELRNVDLSKFTDVLDAGCGNGLISRYLKDKNPGLRVSACDFSDLRIGQAKNLSSEHPYDSIHFFQANLEAIPLDTNSQDFIVCRYVFEYLKDPLLATKEFQRILRPGGEICLIDLDGVFLDFWTKNETLNQQIKTIRENIDINLYVGRRLPAFLSEAGFQNVNYDLSVHPFQSEKEIEEELKNNQSRLIFAREQLAKILGEKEYDQFSQSYLEAMKEEGSTLFFNKFVCRATV